MARTETPGARAVRLINQLTHTKGPDAGRPFNLRPWQVRIVKALFTLEAGRRRYRSALLMLPRKNGKTELAAALVVYFLLFDREIGAEVYSAGRRQGASLVGVFRRGANDSERSGSAGDVRNHRIPTADCPPGLGEFLSGDFRGGIHANMDSLRVFSYTTNCMPSRIGRCTTC